MHLIEWNDTIPIQISLKFVPKSPIDNKPALVQVMAWRRTGDNPLPELMLTSLLTHICDIRGSYLKQLSSLINSGKDKRPSGFWLQLRFCVLFLALSSHKQTVSYAIKKVLQ